MSNFAIAITVIVVVVLLLVASIGTIRIWDSPRTADHVARTLVQTAIAIATVTGAIILFEKQLGERDAQALQQQKWVASSFLRSNILQLVARSRQAALMSGRMAKCEPDQPCKMTPEEIVLTLREDLDNLNDESQKDLYFALPIDRKEYWQMVRNAGPLIPDDFFDNLMESVEDYGTGIETAHALVKQAVTDYNREKENFLDNRLPPARLEFHYNRVSRLQWIEADIVTHFVCYLSDRANELRDKPFKTKNFGTLDEVPTCSPYSDNLRKASSALKPPDKSRLPPEFLKDRKAKGTPDLQ